MSFYENYFNSMALVIITIPFLIGILSIVLQLIIKNYLKALVMVLILQVILYFGYSCIILHMRIFDVSLDYIGYIAIVTLIFGFIGGLILKLKNLINNIYSK